jgi:hypothetical protein
MGERVSKSYQRLFEIRLLHHYWLDEGATVFDLLTDLGKKDARLLGYDARSFLTIRPAISTAKAIDGLGGFFKETAWGCIVAVPSGVVIPGDVTFVLIVTIQSQDVLNYTALTLRSQNIYEVYYQPDGKTYRYKENVPVLSNLTGSVRGSDPTQTLFLSAQIPPIAPDDQVEALVVSGGALVQLTADQPGATTQTIGAVWNHLPVFIHQGDVPVLGTPPGLTGAPPRGILLAEDIPDDIFALIRLAPVRADDDQFSLTDAAGHARIPHPTFHVRFKNRSTVWRYLNKNTGVATSTEPAPLPLTHFGNAGSKQKPSEGLVKVVKSGDRVTQIVSDIFV